MMTARTNNTNDFSKRTASQVAAILKGFNIDTSTVENLGNGNDFSINTTGIKARHAIKKAGFVLKRSTEKDAVLCFKCF